MPTEKEPVRRIVSGVSNLSYAEPHDGYFHLKPARLKGNAPSEDEEDDDASSTNEEYRNCTSRTCCRWLGTKLKLKKIFPGYSPLLMWLTIVVVTAVLAIRQVVKRNPDFHPIPYVMYIVVCGGIFIVWLLLRAIWILWIAVRVTESRLIVALNAVLDPELTYLFSTITICLFWAYIPATGSTTTSNELTTFGLTGMIHTDLRFLLKLNLLLILWAARNLFLSAFIFYFLTGFLMALNVNLVRYLTLYRLIRKLNTNWNRLMPFIGISKRESTGQTAPEIGFRTISRLPSVSNDALKYKLLLPEEEKKDKAKSSKVLNVGMNSRTIQKHVAAREKLKLDFGGCHIPSVLTKKNILRTQESPVANLLSLEYCRQYPPAVFVRGIRYELTKRKETKAYARATFDELVEFRNSVSPEGRTQEERDILASHAVETFKKMSSIEIPDQRSSYAGQEKGSSQHVLRTSYTKTASHLHLPENKNPRLTSLKDLSSDELHAFTYSAAAAAATEDAKRKYSGGRPERPENTQPVSKAPKFTTVAKHTTPLLSEFYETTVDNDYFFPFNTPKLLTESWDDDYVETGNEEESLQSSDNEIELRPNVRPSWSQSYCHGAGVATAAAAIFGKHPKGQEPLAKRLTQEDANKTGMPSVYLTKTFIEILLDKDTAEFMIHADPGGRGHTSRRNFTKLFLEMYKLRKQLLHLVSSQESIRKVVSRMISLFLVFITLLIFLLITGVSADTIIISGAAVISSCTVILSFLYTGFVQAIIFVCFLNPYNVGDRVTIDGQLRTVAKIKTYFTQFNTVHGKVETMNHSFLFPKSIINESRCKHGGLEIILLIEYKTPESKCDALHYLVEEYVQNHQEYVKDSFYCFLEIVAIGHYKKYVYWLTVVDGWGEWRACWNCRAVLMKFINRQCEILGINYTLPLMPIIKSA